MKKYNRQRLILDLIKENEVKTQDQLADLLKENGINATQATISRDIKEMRISKVQTSDGDYKYTILDTVHDSLNERLTKIFRSAVLSVQHNGDVVIVQTIAYAATVCGSMITHAKLKNIAGMVTGHDTIFIAPVNRSDLDVLVRDIKHLMQ